MPSVVDPRPIWPPEPPSRCRIRRKVRKPPENTPTAAHKQGHIQSDCQPAAIKRLVVPVQPPPKPFRTAPNPARKLAERCREHCRGKNSPQTSSPTARQAAWLRLTLASRRSTASPVAPRVAGCDHWSRARPPARCACRQLGLHHLHRPWAAPAAPAAPQDHSVQQQRHESVRPNGDR